MTNETFFFMVSPNCRPLYLTQPSSTTDLEMVCRAMSRLVQHQEHAATQGNPCGFPKRFIFYHQGTMLRQEITKQLWSPHLAERPATAVNRDDFPAPDGPIRATMSPGFAAPETQRRICMYGYKTQPFKPFPSIITGSRSFNALSKHE